MRVNIYHIIAIFLFATASCNHLEFDETSGLMTKEDMYKYFNTTENMLTHVYSFVPQGYVYFATTGSFTVDQLAMRDAASDDGEFGAEAANIQNVNNGNWSPIRTYDDAWYLYEGIRAANGFIQDIVEVDFSRYENFGEYNNWMRKLQYFEHEARVLRAHYFFELARRYGDIAMPLAPLSQEEANAIGKTPFHDVIRFIAEECNEAAQHLPESHANQPDQQVGRVTKGFAMAVKSKALLYAASELHNPSMEKERWEASAKAALDIIELGLYELDPESAANNIESPGVVMMRMNSEAVHFELYNFPIRFTEGERPSNRLAHGNYPSQNLVDAFETINGYKVTLEDIGWVTDDPEFDPRNPYAHRDPRFYQTILANGFEFKENRIETYRGGRDDQPVAQGGTPTGYYLRKYLQESTSFDPFQPISNKHHWIIYRYAETLLTYAESMIQAFDDPNYSDAEFPYSALWALNQVRQNAGMPEVTTGSKQEFIERLYNEWRVEFAFEDHRFWDVRRWKIGDSTQRQLYGVTIERNGDGSLDFYRNLYETRRWSDRMYLYPIPQSELFKNPNLNPQNSGW